MTPADRLRAAAAKLREAGGAQDVATAALLDEVTLFAERYQNGSMARCAVAVADAVLAGEEVGV